MKYTEEEKNEILSHLEQSAHKAESIAATPPRQRKSVWSYSEEEKLELTERAKWLRQLIAKVKQL